MGWMRGQLEHIYVCATKRRYCEKGTRQWRTNFNSEDFTIHIVAMLAKRNNNKGNKRNVLLITLDSMSNMDFQRSMLKTNDVLEVGQYMLSFSDDSRVYSPCRNGQPYLLRRIPTRSSEKFRLYKLTSSRSLRKFLIISTSRNHAKPFESLVSDSITQKEIIPIRTTLRLLLAYIW